MTGPVCWLAVLLGHRGVDPGEEGVEAGGESLVAVACRDVLAEGGQGGKRPAGRDRKKACSWRRVAGSWTRCSLTVVRSLSAKPRV